MTPDPFTLPPFVATPRWLTPRMVMLGTLLGTATLAFARVNASPGVIATAAMLLVAWAPMALSAPRSWVRWVWLAWTASIVVVHLGWYVLESQDPPESHVVGPLTCCAMVGLFAGFSFVWRAFHRESASPAVDSAGQLVVIAGAWLAFAGCVGAVDALTRRDRAVEPVRLAEGGAGVATACLGLLVALVAMISLRRRARWIERVGEGSIEGWTLAYYAREGGDLAAIPRLIGGAVPSNPASPCLLVRRPLGPPRQDASYRDAPANGAEPVAAGRLDATPWGGGLHAALRGEDGLRGLSRMVAIGFIVTLMVPIVVLFVLGSLFVIVAKLSR